MGLIAREIEARGIPTLCMSSALSITQAVNPPRAVYVDYPLGHTSGKPLDPQDQLQIMTQTLEAFGTIRRPGEIRDLGRVWQDDDSWKDRVMRPNNSRGSAQKRQTDDRVERFETPQYQSEADARAADPNCATCVFLADQ